MSEQNSEKEQLNEVKMLKDQMCISRQKQTHENHYTRDRESVSQVQTEEQNGRHGFIRRKLVRGMKDTHKHTCNILNVQFC